MATPNTFLSGTPLEQFLVQYSDGDGRVHDAVGIRIGNEWFLAPNSEEWLKSRRPFHKNVRTTMEERYQAYLASKALAGKGATSPTVPAAALTGAAPGKTV
jgi:hypothetical protein